MSADERKLTRSQEETLAVPARVRSAVVERDQGYCRVGGEFVGDEAVLHHIVFGGDDRGMGGRRVHNPDEIVTLCWRHHAQVHRGQKAEWRELLLAVVQRRGITALQLQRWNRRRSAQAARG